MSIANNEQEILAQAIDWIADGHTVRLVTVVDTWGSSPRPPGSMAVVREDGVLVGSVSGGCIEKQLAESYSRLARDNPTEQAKTNGVITHHIDDEAARRFGLTCGGRLELLFETIQDNSTLKPILDGLSARKRMQRTVVIDSGEVDITSASSEIRFHYDGSVMTQVFGPAWRLLLIGAGQLSRYTAEFALALDYEVIVCEPRREFRDAWTVSGTELIDLSPDDAVLAHGLDAQCAVLALTHDPNQDDLALLEALPGDAFYVGALGSRKNNEKRSKRLMGLGLEASQLARLHGPVGLDIGSRTSAEIAISIIGDLIRVRAQRSVPVHSAQSQHA